eukprot:scaffold42481_cov18-Tisochrysis_lutea.AAC.1
MAESAAQPQQQGKPNLSSKLKSMRFMQRASEKRNLQQLSSKGPQQGSAAAEVGRLGMTAEDADDAACGSGRHVAEGVQSEATGGDSSLPSTSSSQPAPKKGCRVVYGTAPLPGALVGARFSFGGAPNEVDLLQYLASPPPNGCRVVYGRVTPPGCSRARYSRSTLQLWRCV